MTTEDSFESLGQSFSRTPLTSSNDKPIATVTNSLCLLSLDDLHDPYSTLQEKESIVTKADDPQVAVASVSNRLANVRWRSGWIDICNEHFDGDVKAMVDLCTRVLKGTNTSQPSDSDVSVVKEILNTQPRVQALNDVQTKVNDQWSIVLGDLLKGCTLEEQESMGSSAGEEFLDTPLSSTAPGTPEETQECNPEDEACSQLSLSDKVVLEPSLITGENGGGEKGHQEGIATSPLSVPKSISSLEDPIAPLTCFNSEDRPPNGSRSERFLSNLNVGPQSDQVLCQPNYPFTFTARPSSPELPSHKEPNNLLKSNIVDARNVQKNPGAYLKAEDSEAHKRRRLFGSQDYVAIPIPKADWDSSSTFPVAFDSDDVYSVQSTDSGSQSLASVFQEVDFHTETMVFNDDIFNTPNLDIEVADWPTIPEIEDCAYEAIIHEMDSFSAQPTSVSQRGSEAVKMPQDMTWSTDLAWGTVCSETEQIDNTKIIQADSSSDLIFIHVA